MTGADIAIASSQHPKIGQALAELVGSLTERQHLAPSLTLIGLTGHHVLAGTVVGSTIHNLLQSDQTIVFAASGLGGGGQVLDGIGSAAVISIADIEVEVRRDPVDTGSALVADVASSQSGPLRFARSGADPDTASISVQVPDTAGPIWHFHGERRGRGQKFGATLHSVDPILTTSVGAAPIGLPSPVTSIEGNRIHSIDGVPARSLIMDRLEFDGPETDGPSMDLPRMMVELLESPGPKRYVAVTESRSIDQSITLAEAVAEGTVIQVLRHDPSLAADDVINRQLHQRRGHSKAALATSDLSPPATVNLVSTAASTLSPHVIVVLESQKRGPGLPWPTASILTFG